MRKVINFDDNLVEAMQAGDESALEMVIDKYTAYVGTVVWNIIGSSLSQDDAKEIISDVFYTLWKNRSKVNQGKLKAYLGSISRSRAVDALRRSRLDISLDDDLIEILISGPEDNTVKAEEYAALRKALNDMPEPDHTNFVKHYYFYQKTNEIADQLGLNVNTVKAKLRRGREKLRKALTEGGFFIG